MQPLSQGPNRSILASAVLSGYILRIYLRKRFVQPDNRAVLDNQILKMIQFIAQNTTGLLCLKLNRMEHAPLKEISHPRCESLVKTTYAQFHPAFSSYFRFSPRIVLRKHTHLLTTLLSHAVFLKKSFGNISTIASTVGSVPFSSFHISYHRIK